MATGNGMLWSPVDHMPQGNFTPMQPVQRNPNQELDRQAFLNLLMVQLQFQDPLNPMDDRDFMAQMAQFSALEQMVNLNQTFERSQAFGMIGRVVEASFRHSVTGEWVETVGAVEAVTTVGGEAFLLVNGMDVPLSSVRTVGEDPIINDQLNHLMDLVHGNRVQDMVGRYVQALVINRDGEVTDFVEGRVSYIKLNGNQSVLVVGNRELWPREVVAIADGPILLGSNHFTNGSELIDVEIRNARAYLVFRHDVIRGVYDDNGDPVINPETGQQVTVTITDEITAATTSRVPIERINYAMEALKYVGQSITHSQVTGVVQSITIRNAIPFFNVRQANGEMAEINYTIYRDDRG